MGGQIVDKAERAVAEAAAVRAVSVLSSQDRRRRAAEAAEDPRPAGDADSEQ